MDALMNLVGETPQGMESFAYMIRCLIFILVLLGLIDIIKGMTFRISKGGM